jgi:hypothetical protein
LKKILPLSSSTTTMASSKVQALLSICFLAFAIYLRAELRAQRRERLKQEVHQNQSLLEKEYNARLDAMQARLVAYEHEKQLHTRNRITELSEKQTPTLAERRELSWMKAEQREHHECVTWPYLEISDLITDYSTPNPIYPYQAANWAAAEKQGMTANVGTVFHVLSSPLLGYPFRRASYVLARVNQACPWKRLVIVHEEGTDIQNIAHQHLSDFTPIGPMAPPAPAGARWDSETHEWYTPETTW